MTLAIMWPDSTMNTFVFSFSPRRLTSPHRPVVQTPWSLPPDLWSSVVVGAFLSSSVMTGMAGMTTMVLSGCLCFSVALHLKAVLPSTMRRVIKRKLGKAYNGRSRPLIFCNFGTNTIQISSLQIHQCRILNRENSESST